MLPNNIFKAYDIRGIYPTELNEKGVQLLGKAFANFTKAKVVIVGYDMRTSGPSLKDAFIEGLLDQGADAWDVGQISTDASYFAAGKYNVPCVMITASHNPKEYNGLKFTGAGAWPIGKESGLQDIQRLAEAGDFSSKPRGKTEKKEILQEFAKHVLDFVDISAIKPLKIVIDAGNGMAGKVVPIIFQSLPCEIIPLYFELDGNFPNHPPYPMEEKNVRTLVAKVKEVGADMGIAFDGDADRAFFIDEQGNRIISSYIVALLAENILKKNPKESVIYNVPCSQVVAKTVQSAGGRAIRERVGHSFIKATMRKENSVFAGEHSGHYYFRDNYFADSGLLAAVIVLEAVSRANAPFSTLLKKYQTSFMIDETNVPVENKDQVTEELKKTFVDAKSIDTMDGLTFMFDDFWFNVRASNTEPLLRLNMEAKTQKLLQQKSEAILEIMKRAH